MGVAVRVDKSPRFPGLVGIAGWVLAFAAFVFLIKTPIDAFRESRIAKWPSVTATVIRLSLRRYWTRHETSWRIEGLVRYRIAGEVLTSSIQSRTGGLDVQRAMREWVARHGPGTSFPVRYDPQHEDTVVPYGGDMPESGPQVPNDVIWLVVLSLLSAGLITGGRVLRRTRDV
jgi:hypothetical protein